MAPPQQLTKEVIKNWSNPSDATEMVRADCIPQEMLMAAESMNFAFPVVRIPTDAKGHYSLRYAEFASPLSKAIQELDEEDPILKETLSGLNL